MSFESVALLDALVSHAAASGVFDRVNQHEPKVAPGKGVTAAVWFQELGPARRSGLNMTSIRAVFQVRLFTSMLQEPQDAIDPGILEGVDVLMAAYTGDFTLDGLVRNVDLQGSDGPPLSATAGYVEQDRKLFRVVTLTVPLIINDVWEATP